MRPKPSRVRALRNCFGTIWSVSTLTRSSGATKPVWVEKGCILSLSNNPALLMHVGRRQLGFELGQGTKCRYLPTSAILHEHGAIPRKSWRQLLALFIAQATRVAISVNDGNIGTDEADFGRAGVRVACALRRAAEPFPVSRLDGSSSFVKLAASRNPVGILRHHRCRSYSVTLRPGDSVRIEDPLNRRALGGAGTCLHSCDAQTSKKESSHQQSTHGHLPKRTLLRR